MIEKSQEKNNCKTTKKISPWLGLLGFLGFFGFLGFLAYSVDGGIYGFVFFVFFGFFSFYYEGKMSEKRYVENSMNAERI